MTALAPSVSRVLVALASAACFFLPAAALAAASAPSADPGVEVTGAPGSTVESAAAAASSSSRRPQDAAAAYPVRIETAPRGAALEMYAVNDGFAPVNVIIDLTKSKNTGFSPNVIGPNVAHLVAPQSRKLITMAVPLKKGRPMEFAYTHRFAFGDNLAELAPGHKYRLPVPDGTVAVLRLFSGLPFRTNFFTTAHAVELLAAAGTPVVAARPGVVFLVKDGVPLDAPHEANPLGNHVLVLHDDGGWTVYGALQSGSVKVKPGDRLELGQHLAAVGANRVSVDTFLVFGVARALGGLSVSTIPFRFTSKVVDEINPTLFTGPVSPDLQIKYPPAVPDEPWHPPETVLPTPPVISNYGDEDLTPLQRQNLYRQRIIDHANAGRETVGDSSTLVFLGGVAVALSFLAFALSLFNNSKSAYSGARGWLWSLLHGSQPTGSLPFDPNDAKPPIVGPVVTSSIPEKDGAPATADAAAEQDSDAPEGAQAVEDASAAPPTSTQRLHDPQTLELIRHISHSTPLGLLSTHGVPASAIVETASPSESIDFVLIRASDASVVLVVLRAENHHLAHTMSVAGVPHVVLPPTPTAEQVKASIQSALQTSPSQRMAA